MKANFALPNRAFEGTFNPISATPDVRAFGARIASLTRSAVDKLVNVLRPVSVDEAYLNQAQNHADLERRLFEVCNGGYEASRRYFY